MAVVGHAQASVPTAHPLDGSPSLCRCIWGTSPRRNGRRLPLPCCIRLVLIAFAFDRPDQTLLVGRRTAYYISAEDLFLPHLSVSVSADLWPDEELDLDQKAGLILVLLVHHSSEAFVSSNAVHRLHRRRCVSSSLSDEMLFATMLRIV